MGRRDIRLGDKRREAEFVLSPAEPPLQCRGQGRPPPEGRHRLAIVPTSTTPHSQTCQDGDGVLGFLLQRPPHSLQSDQPERHPARLRDICLERPFHSSSPVRLPLRPTPSLLGPRTSPKSCLQDWAPLSPRLCQEWPLGQLGAPFLAQGLGEASEGSPNTAALCCRAGMLLISAQRTHYFTFQTRKPHM